MYIIKALASNGHLLCFRYSSFWAARHNIIFPCPAKSPICATAFESITSLIWEKTTNYVVACCSFHESPVVSWPLGPNILFSALFLKHLQSASSLNIREQVSHMNRVMSIITVMYVFYLIFDDLNRRKDVKFGDKRFQSD
jgi:hypothetical protein